MGLLKDLTDNTAETFKTQFAIRDGQVVPETDTVKLGNDAVRLNATVLYADMVESTQLVDGGFVETFAPKIYKVYLDCACRIIKANGGSITAFDGDRVMAVFIGNSKNSSAAKSALQINRAVQHIINPQIKTAFNFTGAPYQLRQAVGIDTGEMLVARTGIRGSNDLVWVGKAANHAAKLCGIRDEGYPTLVSPEVFNEINADYKIHNGNAVWESRQWKGKSVYRSSWWWTIPD